MIAPCQVYAVGVGLTLLVVRKEVDILTDGWRCLVLHSDGNQKAVARALCYRGAWLREYCERIA